MHSKGRGSHEHEALQRFAHIASELRRLESFEAELTVELLRLRESIAALSATPLPLLKTLLDGAAVPAR